MSAARAAPSEMRTTKAVKNRFMAASCDGWVGFAYPWHDAVSYVQKLKSLRREYGRDNEPFDIVLALLEQPTPDLYKRAEDIGITATMCSPWGGLRDTDPGNSRDVERYRAPIERFAEKVMSRVN